MDQSKRDFIDFMCSAEVLTFGDFVTKSGRSTPYFVNTGRYTTGAQMEALGAAYARSIVERFGDRFDVLFGPAYKGIPLVVAAASALAREHGRDVPLFFNRKEAKDHGEGGALVGATDKYGAEVIEDPFNEENLFATIFSALDIDPHAEFKIDGFPTFHHVENKATPISQILS